MRKLFRPFIGLLSALILAGVATLGTSQPVLAEGTSQLNDMQSLSSTTVVYADILTSGETINISTCQNATINIWNTNGTPAVNGDDTQVVTNAAFTANLVCGSAIPATITNPYKYTATAAGTYRITYTGGTIARYDFSVTPNSSTNPTPASSGGRVWSYNWQFSTGSYAASAATDADLYIMVPGANNGENFIWKLDLNKFSGNGYTLSANSLGLNPPYSGLSATQAVSGVTPEYRIYLGYPSVAGNANTSTPVIGSPQFLDDANEDNIFSPGTTVGVQDTGNFKFTSNVANANYAVTIDTNQDGVYGTGDRLLLGKATLGANSVAWDGKYPNGSPVPVGIYHARVQLRLGEYHFIAQDVETSGGTLDNGLTWSNGLTIYRATGPTAQQNTTVYWDDLTELSGQDYPSANVPNGVTSGSLADANSDGRPDGFHTWGTFSSGGVGNNNNIDTYVYGPSTSQTVTIAVANSEAGDADGVAAAIETGAANNGDGNADGTADFLQDLVTSLPNPVSSGAYNTLTSSGCTNLSNISLTAENSLSSQDSAYDYPAGLARLNVNCASNGSTTTVKQYFDQQYTTTGWTARALVGSTYINIPGAVFGTAVVGGATVTTLTYSVTDGGALDTDGAANGVISLSFGPGVVPTDTDGISLATEAAGPNSGDANNDGQPDSQQNTVTAWPNQVSGTYNVLQTTGCISNANVSTQSSASYTGKDSTYQYPMGLMDFQVNCATPGATATVTQYYYGSLKAADVVARKYNATTQSYATVPNAMITNVTIGGQAALKIVYAITDGSNLDEDGLVNGVIADPVGPAIKTAAVLAPNTGLEPSSIIASVVELGLGIGLALYLVIRSRRRPSRHASAE